ncbi:MAG TPA: phosphate acyltransferase PlsX, partial [Candidatus Goldiibacteriota bacterium]|nr:phosphate acyltransferase PlsX [Candidatus Goldiibacteriota bacterium]
KLRDRLQVVNATEDITMSDHPAQAYKQKPDSSMVVAANMVGDGRGDAFVSAGNTGAMVVSSLFSIGRIPGVSRPAILVPMPSSKGTTALLDAGGNVDCKPHHLVQFAIMGSLYARHIFRIENPTVGMLSIGEEDTKGNELTANTKELIEKAHINYKGHVEGKDIAHGVTDVVVCDGFVGNVILKFGEGVVQFVFDSIKQEVQKGGILKKVGALLMKSIFREMKKKFSFDEYGGAPLLGIKKPVIITHGRANAKAIKNSIRVAAEFIRDHINEEIEENIKGIGGEK